MPNVFASVPGQVIIVKGSDKLAGSVAIVSIDGVTPVDKAIIVGMHVLLETDVAYMRSLSDSFYVFPFGDKPSDLTVDLLVISELACGDKVGKLDLTGGMKSIAATYKSNRVTFGSAKAITITLGGGALKLQGLLTSMEFSGNVEGEAPVVRAKLYLKAWLNDV